MASLPAVLAALLAVVALAACGGPADPTGPAARQSAPSVVTAPTTSSAAPSARSDPAAQESRLLLSASDLPAGWRDSSADGDYRTTVCGVDLEPVAAASARSLRFARTAIGPFLAQYVRTYEDDQAREVAARLAAALPGCTSYTVDYAAAGRRVSFSVAPLRVAGLAAGDVSWRQTSMGTDTPVTADYVLAVRGRSVVVLASYQVKGAPDPAVLETAYRALQGRS